MGEKMKIKKIIMSCMLLLVSVITFVGCANIEYIRAVDGNNVIIDRFVVELNEDKIKKSGQTLAKVSELVENDMQLIVASINTWKSTFQIYPDLYTSIESGIYAETVKSSEEKLTLSIQFAGPQMFGLFYGYVEAEDFEYQKMMDDIGPFVGKMLQEDYSDNENLGLFLYKYSLIKQDGILDSIKDLEINGVKYYEKYRSATNKFYDIKDIELSQIFTYPDSRIHSNADIEEVMEGLTMLKWDLTGDETYSMEIYKLAPRSISWYILALVISLLAIIAIAVIIKKKKKEPVVKITKQEVEKNER